MDRKITKLDELLRKAATAKGQNGAIALYDRFHKIKDGAREWLHDLDKNGFEHSERLEKYLNGLTRVLTENERLTYPEIFVLLCAVYMHDLGYLGDPTGPGHEKRSHDLILDNPEKYFLDDFPVFGDGHAHAAKAIALVCYGHARELERPLSDTPHEFADQTFEEGILNLRKLAALLRLADEADDPYLRLSKPLPESTRSHTPLVEVGEGTITWYRDRGETGDPRPFVDSLEQKKQLLASSLDYLSAIGAGRWHLAIHPDPTAPPFMAQAPVETFVGRERDLDDLHAIIRERGVGAVTGVVGTGGIGKTELARRYAERYRKDYSAGVFWASFRGSTWREEGRKILAALYPGWNPDPFPDDARAREEVCKRLNHRGALLIIDNVNEADEIIKPGCFVLVTTRERRAFGMVPRKAVKELGRFSDREGKDLLVEILGNARIERDPVGASRIVEILGGMPLALEIAASHLAAVPDQSFPDYIGQIQGKIEELKLKDAEDKDVVASLELSLRQLETSPGGAESVAVFEAGSVCAESGFTSRTLAGTVNIDHKVAQIRAGELRDRSVFEFSEGTSRFAMHPLLRQLAEMRLDRDQERERRCRTNHCLYFLRFAEAKSSSPEELVTEKDGLWQAMVQGNQIEKGPELLPQFLRHLTSSYRRMIAEKEHEAAFRYLVDTNLISIDELGLAKDLTALLDVLVANKGALQETSRGWVCTSLGSAYLQLGEYRKAIGLCEKALEIARRIGDVRGEGSALGNMGSAYLQLGEYRKAIDLHEKALEIVRRIGDVRGEGGDLGNMGSAYCHLGEYRKAIDLYEKHLEIARRIGDVRGEGSALGNMGSAYLQLGEYRKAIDLHEKALEIDRRIGDVQGEGSALGNMGLAYANLGEYRKAIDLYEKALEIARRIGDVRGEGSALGNMGLAYMKLGEYRKAIDLYEQHLEIARRIGDVQGEGNALGNMGLAYANLGEYRKAIDLHEKALEIARRIGNVRGEGSALGNMGAAYAKAGSKEKAAKCLQEGKAIFEKLGLQHLVEMVDNMAKSAGL